MTVLHNCSQHLQQQDEENVYALAGSGSRKEERPEKTSEPGGQSSLSEKQKAKGDALARDCS